MKMTGAEIAIRLLERQDIHLITGIPGGANLPLYDALSQSTQISHVLARHEQGAGFIAQGMARVSGRAQVCFATSGPGATNILTALADAKLDSIPVICFTGQVARSLIGTDAFQEVDTYGLTIPITKHNFLVQSAAELLQVIPDAFRIATSGRPGPVLIDIPKDVQTESVEFSEWPEPGRADPAPTVNDNDISQAAELINSSRRPVLYLGGGVIHSEAAAIATLLAEKASIPVTMTLMGLGAVPIEHPRSIGMLGMHAARYTNMVLEECDLLIGAGVRFDDRATGNPTLFCPTADIIHIDIDECELHKIKTAHVGIRGDIGDVLKALFPMVDENPRAEWLSFISDLREKHPPRKPNSGDLRNPVSLITQAAEVLDPDTVIVTDVGQHQMWVAQTYPFRRPRRWLTSGGLGTMGFGLPAAIGAALACPDQRVVCFSGDGSIMMNIQELATAVDQNLNIKIILMNNSSLGLVCQQQDLFYGGRIYASRYQRQVDFIRIAEGFGMQARDLATADDPLSMLCSALKERGPCLIHAPIHSGAKVYPMVPPGAANRNMITEDANACAVS
ncbi:acetolactate synthase large subunit [Desulfomonile tiedjei]|uniref:Acetolactate synthase n=1 Tax=Desulfomonile tiedjei (strain ATCC 49306 / DSM 6799 / DCB-1) TaxID=706587 RepID=I4CD76_DESTA|nr:acetolactate synthase large subunit [Desulfomonile tiedjei]AFM27517.1 acetolactate synthase, large subunit [Desulfomonile tiedjei DSM 6799]